MKIQFAFLIIIMAAIFANFTAVAQETDKASNLEVHCGAIPMKNSGSIVGILKAADDMTVQGPLTVTLLKTGINAQPKTFTLNMNSSIQLVSGGIGAQGEEIQLRVIRAINPGEGIANMVLSLDLPGMSSYVLMNDATKYFFRCK